MDALATAPEPLSSGTEPLSVTGLIWRLRDHDPLQARAICQQGGLPEIIGRLLAGRGIALQDAEMHLKPTLKSCLPDPFHLKDMDKAAARVARAIMTRETVAVFGDYDVDGATSSALLIRYFRAFGLAPLVHIPDRMVEGYGPNAPALLRLAERGAKLVITVDCGTTAFEPLKAAKEAGLEVIVIDHHKGDSALPDAFAVVNPNRLDETSPHTQMAACGVTFLLLVAVNRLLREAGRDAPDLIPLLDLVALGTICDVMPLTGVNRALVTQGLRVMRMRGNAGIAAAMDVGRLSEAPGTYHAGFVIGPRINAGGRVGESGLGTELLSTDDPIKARELAERLDQHNAERKAIEAGVQMEAMALAEALDPNDAVILVASRGWHPGVIGIVAGRLKERFHKPVAVIALENGIGKASARSITGVDLGAAVLSAVQAGLLPGGGGHAMAAGFSIEEERIAELRAFFNQRLGREVAALSGQRHLWLDADIAPGGVTLELARLLDQLGPFGAGNPSIRLRLAPVRAVNTAVIGDGHVRAILVDAATGARSSSLKAMCFRSADTPLGQALLNARGKTLQVAGQIRVNEWQGRESVDFFIDDVMY